MTFTPADILAKTAVFISQLELDDLDLEYQVVAMFFNFETREYDYVLYEWDNQEFLDLVKEVMKLGNTPIAVEACDEEYKNLDAAFFNPEPSMEEEVIFDSTFELEVAQT